MYYIIYTINPESLMIAPPAIPYRSSYRSSYRSHCNLIVVNNF